MGEAKVLEWRSVGEAKALERLCGCSGLYKALLLARTVKPA